MITDRSRRARDVPSPYREPSDSNISVDLTTEVLGECVHPERVPPRHPVGRHPVARPALEEKRDGVHEGGEEPTVEARENIGRVACRPVGSLNCPGTDATHPVVGAGKRALVVVARRP